jgi:hypothetical protein
MQAEAAPTPNPPPLRGRGGVGGSHSFSDRKRGIRRTALWTSLLALAFYLGFILLGVLNSR